MRRSISFSLLLATAVFASTLSAIAGASDNPQWTGTLAADQVISIKDVSGDVRAESASGQTAEISATISGRDADRVRVVFNKTSDGIEACVVYERDSDYCGHNHSDHDIRATVDFSVKVPRNVRFHGDTVNGSVEAEDLGANAEVSSVNGNAYVSTAGYAEAKSVNGNVRVKMGRADWEGSLRLESVNGQVEATVPGDLNADVRFETLNGSVRSDFPYTVSGGTSINSHGSGTHIEARIGSGGRSLRMQSVNGSIELMKE